MRDLFSTIFTTGFDMEVLRRLIVTYQLGFEENEFWSYLKFVAASRDIKSWSGSWQLFWRSKQNSDFRSYTLAQCPDQEIREKWSLILFKLFLIIRNTAIDFTKETWLFILKSRWYLSYVRRVVFIINKRATPLGRIGDLETWRVRRWSVIASRVVGVSGPVTWTTSRFLFNHL